MKNSLKEWTERTVDNINKTWDDITIPEDELCQGNQTVTGQINPYNPYPTPRYPTYPGSPCPGCGYCPTCGRGRYGFGWPTPYITCETTAHYTVAGESGVAPLTVGEGVAPLTFGGKKSG